MINPGENIQKLDPQELKGQDKEAYDRLAQEQLAAQENLEYVKNNPLGTSTAQQARVNSYQKNLIL